MWRIVLRIDVFPLGLGGNTGFALKSRLGNSLLAEIGTLPNSYFINNRLSALTLLASPIFESDFMSLILSPKVADG
jgi:hypothetical protein